MLIKEIIKTKSIKCPVCGNGKILKVKDSVRLTELTIYLPNEIHKAKYFVKCPCCKKQIGIL